MTKYRIELSAATSSNTNLAFAVMTIATFSGMGSLSASADVVPGSFLAGTEASVTSSDDFSASLGTHVSGKSPLEFFNGLPSTVLKGLLGKFVVDQVYPWLIKAWDVSSQHLHHALASIINRWSDH